MIYYSVPYSIEKNLGKYYNDFMRMLPSDDDYGCFVDGDTMFTTTNYGHIINDVVNENPDVGCFTCYTNRIGCKWQVAPGVDQDTNDMNYHRNFGLSLQTIFGSECEDMTDVSNKEVLSGHLMLLKKSVWKKIGGFAEKGMLGIDNDLHWKIKKNNEKVYIMKGIYIFHWYRWPDPKNKSHLI
jgi:GT2 family glycosyltransferase